MRKFFTNRLVSILLICAIVNLSVFSTGAFFCAPDTDENVARIYICHSLIGIPAPGHLWVYFQNLTEHEIKVGCYTVPINGGVSAGTFGLTRVDGFGVYYNLESYCGNYFGLNDVLYLCEDINEQTLEKVSRVISNFNYWDPFFNCSFFACAVWNSASHRKVIPFMFPIIPKLFILAYGAQKNPIMIYPDRNEVYKQRGFGSKAYLQTVKDGSLKIKIG